MEWLGTEELVHTALVIVGAATTIVAVLAAWTRNTRDDQLSETLKKAYNFLSELSIGTQRKKVLTATPPPAILNDQVAGTIGPVNPIPRPGRRPTTATTMMIDEEPTIPDGPMSKPGSEPF